MQSVHRVMPALDAYVPAPHDVHVAAAEEVDPTGPYLPAAHKEPVQAAAAEEVDPAGPCVPAAHTEPEQVEAPTTAEYLPASQPWHVAAPAVLESLPASQSVQEVAPEVAAENFPAAQVVQV